VVFGEKTSLVRKKLVLREGGEGGNRATRGGRDEVPGMEPKFCLLKGTSLHAPEGAESSAVTWGDGRGGRGGREEKRKEMKF